MEIPNAFRGDAKHHSLRAESTAGSIYRRIKKMHGLYFFIFHPLQSFKLHLYKMKPLRLFMELSTEKNHFNWRCWKYHSMIDVLVKSAVQLVDTITAFLAKIKG